ncbi:DegT/DnrJ/EryC1/StrS family aminotransferase [Clostridium sp. CM027]|uniref:DegT/DnrJ/EryC1/StrS family aminotransferase n=1 Tax=Clostridium sp. CM027 TaxID=2849865 RepID=UPI001C6E5E11|nr:DegT/DnrJ/EryC1/StrS family aminotransferase [Clostridium sp. CM027]MBW9145242.1 DegT/DnrJ/EryC1/StrS family aminotransferase [Clostridium sp. CM027]UVE40375.1 DegT/DnrJ/EryC1/StrS family aminotransferase [Clostridium sp. CM027]
MKIPFSPPDISEIEINEVIDTLKSGWITTGPKTKLFEKKMAEYMNTSKVVCLNSDTASMEMTLRVLGVGKGDEVITSAYTYTASASVIDHVGSKIILVDTAKNSFQMDYEQLEKAITEKTKVIIPVDIGGVMCDYDKIFEIVNRKKELYRPANDIQKAFGRVVVLADSAHAFGASYKGKRSGEVADFTCFSFHAVKNLTTGEGGAVTWRDIHEIDNEEIYRQYMLLSLHGQSKDALAKTKVGSWEYDIIYPAYKCNMTDIIAALGLAQLGRYNGILERRKQIIEMYDKALNECNVETMKHYGEGFSSSGHLYLVRLIGKDEAYRNRIIEKMAQKNIATNVHYKPLPMHTAYKRLGFDIIDYPNAFDMYKNEITLPLYQRLTNEQVEYVVESLKEIMAGEAAASLS